MTIRKGSAKDTWWIEIDAGPDPTTGKRRRVYERVRGSRSDAARVERKLKSARDDDRLADAGRVTVADYLVEHWLPLVRERVRLRTVEGYESVIRTHLVPGLGRIKLGALRPVHIEKFRAAMRERARASGRPLSDGTQLNIHRVLSEALNEAVRMQLLATNPARAVRLGKPRRAKRAVLTDDAASGLLLAARGTEMEVPVALAVGAGLRRSEIGALRWSDVNLDAEEVSVERSLQGAVASSHSGSRRATPPGGR